MSNGITPHLTPGPAPVPNTQNLGVVCTLTPFYPTVVTPGQGGYPPAEGGPRAIAPGCAFGLPTISFAGGPWQPYPATAKG